MKADRVDLPHESGAPDTLSPNARLLRTVHTAVGVGELACLGYLWFCGITRRRDRRLNAAVVVLLGEGFALVTAKGCPLGVFQRRVGDEVPMFELWFGSRFAHFAIPVFATLAGVGIVAVVGRPPREAT